MRPRIRFYSIRDLLLQINGDLLNIENHWVPYFQWGGLSKFEIMVLILEDRRFCRHIGFDWISCVREALKAITFRKHGGASTIDMQFVRTVTGYKERTLKRKLYDILLAILIQIKYTKLEILRAYLNSAFFGSHLIGADVASVTLFDKMSAELEDEDASRLAAMLVYPRPLIPIAGWSRKVERRAEYARSLYPLLKKRFEKLPI